MAYFEGLACRLRQRTGAAGAVPSRAAQSLMAYYGGCGAERHGAKFLPNTATGHDLSPVPTMERGRSLGGRGGDIGRGPLQAPSVVGFYSGVYTMADSGH